MSNPLASRHELIFHAVSKGVTHAAVEARQSSPLLNRLAKIFYFFFFNG